MSKESKREIFPMNVHAALSLLVFGCLTACLVIIGVFSYTLLWRAEDAIYRDSFSATANELADKIMTRANRVARDGVALATTYGNFYPEYTVWPNAYVSGFAKIAKEFESAQPPHGGVYVMPIVYPDQVASFEAYMQQQYLEDPDISDNTGYHDFGFGIYANDADPYHDISGNSTYGSPNKFLTPMVTVVDYYETDHHLWNPHNDYPVAGMGMDGVFACVQAGNISCQAMLQSDNTGPKSGVLFVTPIFPRHSQQKIVGFIVTAFLWDTILRGSVARLANDIQMVISVNGDTFTCRFDGQVVYIAGEGDQHDTRFNSPHHEAFVYLANTTAANSVVYTLKLYPTQAFYDSYHTNLPFFATIMSMSMILITVMIFIFYDRYVKSDSESKMFLLEEKRRFVRFISHEIRTPLNTAMMGLQLLDEQLKMDKHQETKAETSNPEVKIKEDEDVAHLVSDVKMSTEAALDVLNDLLHYDKIEMGKMKIEIGIVDMWQVIEDTVNMFSLQAVKSEVTMSLVTPFCGTNVSAPANAMEEIRSLRVIGDNIRLAQACRNLISNALKFSDPSSELKIVSRYHSHGLPNAIIPVIPLTHRCFGSPIFRCGSLLFTVQDQGAGMSREELKDLFGEGVQFQANKLQAGAGSGLGLFISKSIIEMHGGKIWATSEGSGRGSTFCIELPLCKEPVEADNWTAESDTCAQPSPRYLKLEGPTKNRLNSLHTPSFPEHYSPLHTRRENHVRLSDDDDEEMGIEGGVLNMEDLSGTPLRSAGLAPHSHPPKILQPQRDSNSILVVDDAPSNRKLLVKLLERRGFECITAEDGMDCLRKVESNPKIGVIVMDFQMPNMTGPEATRKLRESGLNDIVIVGVTGNIMPDDVTYFLEAGANAVLSKPLNFSALQDILAQSRC